jgi:fumarylpyruvate hydrolase
MTYLVPALQPTTVAIANDARRFPVRRIYCVGRNYADHAKEMGAPVEKGRPVFFTKPADAVRPTGSDVPYPPATKDLHHEVELVLALRSGGRDIALADALGHVAAIGVGLDLTRRDLQAEMKAKGLPWDIAKAFDASAPLSDLRLVAAGGVPEHAELWLEVNGARRQVTDIAAMLFSPAEIIHELSKLFELAAGDLIFTGTPAGVAALVRGDTFRAGLDGECWLEGRVS